MAGEEKWAWRVIDEVEKAVVGKRDILTKIMTAILAGGHILIEDIPGTGKTTMALAFSRAMGLEVKRVQFTPDVLPSDLPGFTVYQKETGKFVYQPGAAICNLLLADEINRTLPKTQSALLEVMEEQPAGSAGTQLLPESQLDRFMICVSMGYPTLEEEMKILRRSQGSVQAGERITDSVEPILDAASLLQLRKNAGEVFVHELIYRYIAELAQATRENEWVELGLSPRGTVALTAMAKARAYLKGRAFVIPADVAEVFPDVASHRLILNMKAKVGHIRTDELIRQVIESVPQPSVKKRR